MGELLEWQYKTDDVGAAGLADTRTASAAEREAVAGALGILAVDALTAELAVDGVGGGRYRLHGRVVADVVQACVVSLEPVKGTVEEEIDIEFWPAGDIGPLAEGEHSVLEGDLPEPLENGRIDAGRIVYEVLASGLDPYPRAPEASLQATASGPGGKGDSVISPFAALAKLKPKA